MSELDYSDLVLGMRDKVREMDADLTKLRGMWPLDAQAEALLVACAARGITSPFDLEIALQEDVSAVRSAVEVEATTGFEPVNRGFAVLSTTQDTPSPTVADDHSPSMTEGETQ